MSQPAKRFPHSLVLIFAMVVAAQLATYVLPAGEFQRVEVDGRLKVVADSYETVEAEALPPWHALLALSRGLEEGADVIFLVFLVGACIAVIRATGAIDALIAKAIGVFGGRPTLLVGGMLTLFALGSSTIGMAEEYMPFIPILVSMCLALEMDAMVAVGIVYIGAGIGYGCAALNPFTVMIAKDIAELDPASGQWLRWAILPLFLALGLVHIMRYARRVRADRGASLVSHVDYSEGYAMPDDVTLTGPRLAVLAVFVGGILLFVWGAVTRGWYLVELNGVFLGMAVLAALIGRLGFNATAETFCKGAAEMTTTALLIGFARTIQVVLDDGRVADTVIHGIAQPLQELGPQLGAVGMFAVQSVCNLFIPSGSGQAYVTMPVMVPLADLSGISRETAVLAYQFGDGFTNMIVPTNALLMGMLALGRIPYGRWLKFLLPLMLQMAVLAALVLVFAAQNGF